MKRMLNYLVPAAAIAVIALNLTVCGVSSSESASYDSTVAAPSSPAVSVGTHAEAYVATVGSVSAATGTEHAPDFSWIGPDGKVVTLGSYKGKVVMVNFWATWCPPCRRELPDVVELRTEYKDRGFEVIGVSISERPDAGLSVEEHVAAFAREKGLNYPLVIGNDQLVGAYGGIESIPTTFIVDREGKVAQVISGMMTADEMRRAVAQVM